MLRCWLATAGIACLSFLPFQHGMASACTAGLDATQHDFEIAASQQQQQPRERRTRDGSVYIFDVDAKSWRLKCSPKPTVQEDSRPQLQLGWAQFNVSFDGDFSIANEAVLLRPGRGLRPHEEQQHGDTGRSLWDGAVALAKLLEHCRWLVADRAVLEVGSGQGLVGLSAARLGASRVVMTDLPYTVEDLQASAELNGFVQTGSTESRLQVEILDWAQPAAFFHSRPTNERFDLLLGADVIWLIELVPILVGSLHALAERSPGISVILVHQTRSLSVEESFLAEMESAGFEMSQELRGGSQLATAEGAPASHSVSWHPSFVPDSRIKLWWFRLKQ